MPKHKFERGQIVRHYDGSIYIVDDVVYTDSYGYVHHDYLRVRTVYEASDCAVCSIAVGAVVEILGQVEP